MATPDHKAPARPSFPLDEHLTSIPDGSHHAALGAHPRHSARSTARPHPGGNHLAHPQRGAPLHTVTGHARRDRWIGMDSRPVPTAGAACVDSAPGISG
jgi:hypothetical protein